MESTDNNCMVCHEHVEIYAIGKCDHPICFKCSTRMRALCEQFYCPICRADLPEVFFFTTLEKFGQMPIRKFITNRKLKIQFENEDVREKFELLLEHKCRVCKDRYPEKSFKALRDHMRRVHTLFYCDLCLELKIFSSERKVYNRQELATHRRVGDKDDKSYKGHPLCQFCEERYLDKDELYKHLRKDHYFCHFCESLGSQEFYNDYPILQEHFRTDHYLCEEGDCYGVEFTNAFRSEIDFKGHQAQCHSKATNKLQARQERKINIDINYAPRPNSRAHRGGRDSQDDYDSRRAGPRHQGSRGGRGGKHANVSHREKNDIDRAIQASLSTMNDADMKRDVKDKTTDDQKKPEVHLSQNEENFPVLGGKSDTAVATSRSSPTPSSTTTTTASKASLADRFAMSHSMSVQHGTLNDFPTLSASAARSDSPKNVPPSKGSSFASANKPKPVVEDFPELPTGKPIKNAVSTSWVKPGNPVNERDKPNNKRVKQSHNSKLDTSAYSVNDFPSLGAPTNASINKKWFSSNKSTEPPPNKSKPSRTVIEEDNSDSYNIMDRFSPVNVPDSPKTDKNKNKKKKKKDKVTEIKAETSSTGGSLRGNNSLDDIASLLITDSSSVKPEPVVAQNDFNEVPKPKQEKSKGKKKVDKVENRMGSAIPLENKFEELNLYNGLNGESKELLEPEPVKFTVAEEFPALGSNSAPRKPPPGFRPEVEAPKSAAPPGFSKTSSYQPPPGFGSQNTAPISFPEREFIPMSTDLSNFVYAQPDDFQDRNRMLIGSIQSYIDKDPSLFSDFKQISGEFRRSEVSARQYYLRCEEILGEKNFNEVFPELLALLPDINKQQELLSVYMMSGSFKRYDKDHKIGSKSKSAKGAWTETQSGFLSCTTCRQVLSRKDYNQHISMHDLNSDFPSLAGNKVPTSKFTSGPWVKA